MAENERYDGDSHLTLAAGTTTSFSHLLFAEEEEEEDDICVGLNGMTTQIFKCSTSSSSSSGFFRAELLKKPKMLCFGDHYPNKEDQMIFSETKSGVTCSDSSSSASSTNSTVSKSINRKRNQESVQCTSAITTSAVADQRSSKKIKTENPTSTATPKRKEKLGERIAALQQLVSPFGKTDTASVLHEAMGYIRFLQEQVQVLCSPYLLQQQQQQQRQQRLPSLPDVEGGENGNKEGRKDLRSRGLCLVPVECTVHVARTNGADFWTPAMASNVSSSTKR